MYHLITTPPLFVGPSPLCRVLQQGDFFSLQMPLLPSTKNMFNDEVFAKIKKGARIINVARGGVIDEAALARALDAGQVGPRAHMHACALVHM
jgi:D-3-phosphoglycerate dehydrogenase